jgi:hypothetical protein
MASLDEILGNLPDKEGGVSAVLENLPDKSEPTAGTSATLPELPDREPFNYANFAETGKIDDSTASVYRDSTVNSLAFDLPASETFKGKKAIDLAVSHTPSAVQFRRNAESIYGNVSTLGASWQYTTKPENVELPSDRLSSAAILRYAEIYREQGLITEQEYQNVITSDNPGKNLFNIDAVYTTAYPPLPKHFYDKTVGERAAEAGPAIAGGVNHALGGFARGIQWLEGETGVTIGARGVAEWFEENAEIATEGVRPDIATDFWGAVGSMSTLVLPAAGVGRVARLGGLTERMALSLEMNSATVGEALMEAGGSYQARLSETGSVEEANKAARISFGANVALIGVTNRMGLYKARHDALAEKLGQIENVSLVRKAARATAEGARGEFGQEAGQEIISQVAEEREINLEDAAYAGFIGALVGGPTAAFMTIAANQIDEVGPMPPEVERVYDETVEAGLAEGLTDEQAHVRASQAIQEVEGGPEYTNKVMQAQEAVMRAEAAMGRDVGAPVTEAAPVDITSLAEQVEAGTITEEQAVEQFIDSLIEPIRGEEGAVTVGEEPELIPQEREREIDRGLERLRATGEIDMASPFAQEIIDAKLLLDELGAEGTAATVQEARRRAEIEDRGREQEERRRGVIQEELRQQEVDRGLTLFTETGEIDLASPVAVDIIKARILNEAYTVRDNFSDILDIGRAVFAEGKTALTDFTNRVKEALGEAWEKVKPFIETAWDVLRNERGAVGRPEQDHPLIQSGAVSISSEGNLTINDPDAIPDKVWGKINTAMKRAGFDSRGAQDVKEFFSRFKGEIETEFFKDQINAFVKGAGLDISQAQGQIISLHNKARREFGTTDDINEGGYILPNGSMLDFSGKREGGTPGKRAFDHRDIGRVDEDSPGGTEGMRAFMDTGAVRMDGSSGAIDISSPITPAQRRTIAKIVRANNGDVRITLRETGQEESTEKEFPIGTNPARVLNEIDRFYGDEAGFIDLEAEISLAPVLERLRSFRDNPAQGLADITNIGRSIFDEGKTSLKDFTARMREILGDLWTQFKDVARQAWEIVNNERGAIRIGREGQPEIDLQDRIQAIRAQVRSQELPSFMQDNPTWSEEEVDVALDRAQQGQEVTKRQADMVHAALAEAGAQFYQEAVEDEFITLEPADVDRIVQDGIQDYVSNLKVVVPVELTAEQKKKKARTQEFRKRGQQIKKLQDELKETAFLLHESVLDQASIRQQSKQNTKEAKAEVKRLESKIATRDKRIAELREKAKDTGRKLPKKTVKAQVRETTGQIKSDELRQLERSLKRQEQIARDAEKAGRRNFEAEQKINEIQKQIGTVKQQIARTTGIEKSPELRDLARSLLRQEQTARRAEREGRTDEAQKVRARIKDQIARREGKKEETAQRNKTRAQIKKMLKSTKPRKEGGKPVGKFTPEVQRALDKLRQAANLSKAEADLRIGENLNKYQDEIPPEEIALENRVLSLVHGVGRFGTLFSNELAQIRDEIREMIDQGRMINELRRFNRQARYEKERGEAIDVITGGEGIPAGADQKTRKANYNRIHGLTDRAKRWFATTGKSMVGWKDILDILSRLDPSKPFESALSQIGDVLDAKNTEKQGIRDTVESMQDMYRSAYDIPAGRAGDRQMVKQMREDSRPIDLGTFTDLEGNRVPIEISRSEARKRYMELQDPSLTATFREGMAYTDDMIGAITDLLTPQDKAFADAQLAFYQDYYISINEVYRDLYGLDLPRNEFYSPIRREGFKRDEGSGFGEFLQEINLRASTTPGGLKNRVENLRTISQESDTSVLEQHTAEMEHFKAWAEKVRDLRAVFNDTGVRAAIEIFHGKDILGVVDNFVDDFARGGVDRGLKISWMDKWRGRIARSVLAIKPSIGAKQLTSFIAYADSMPTTDFVKNYAEFWKNPVKNTQFIYEHSTLLKSRRQHMERDIQQAQQTDAFKTWRKGQSFLDALMLNIHIGDEGAIVMGGWPLIKHQLDKGATIEEAIRKFEQVTESTQQSADLSELSAFQRGGSFAKLFTLYRSSPNQYMRKIMAATRNAPVIGAGRQSTAQSAKTFAIFWVLLPMLFQFVSDGFTWDEDEQERAVIFGPLNGVFIIGDILDGLVRKALDEKIYDSEIPLMSVKDDAIRAMDLITEDNLTDEEFYRAIRAGAGAVGSVTGAPLKTLVDIGAGVDEVLTGDFEQGAIKALGWSPSAARKRGGESQRRR